MNDFQLEIKNIQSNKFVFLNYELQFDDTIEWHTTRASHLWRYNLHYFEYGISLGLAWTQDTAITSYYNTFKSLVLSWIENNQQVGIGDGWHPYTLSLRLVNWTYAYDLFRTAIEDDVAFKQALLESYWVQSYFLSKNIEWDVLGNHLIENGKALVYAGLFLEGPFSDSILNKGLTILWGQLNDQILADGGHYERSPMYHQIVLKDYLEVIRLLRIYERPIPEWVYRKLEAMVHFQNQTLHPDGKIPLLNDSAFHIASSSASIRLLSYGMGVGSAETSDRPDSLLDWLLIGHNRLIGNVDELDNKETVSFFGDESGYYVYKGEKLFLIADAGQSCPDFLPAHAHADFGNYELSFGGKRWIVDSGVYQYQGDLRNTFRSTAAHNCLMINGRNQSDVWGNFRLAKRARPTAVYYSDIDGVWALSASHDGYHDIGVNPVRKFLL
ncbi:alginate lyase family protein [Cohnella cholangitidis]|nr:alginate lyase family protein [Cohnella cholangitidis]